MTSQEHRNKTRQALGYLLPIAIYILISLIIIRLDFGNRQYPGGTNILDTFMTFYNYKINYITPLYTLSDWGQPFPGFTGPTLLLPLIEYFPITPLIRILEFIFLFSSGIIVYSIVKNVTRNSVSALISGLYYLLLTETSQFFEGHFAMMFTFAFYPLFLYFFYKLLNKPDIKYSLLAPFVLYLLFSIGDIGGFYMIVVATIPFALYFLYERMKTNYYSKKEVALLFYSVTIFILLTLSWSLPYFLGAKPEFTTNITTGVLPFKLTSGELPFYSFSGFIADSSYTYFYLHSLTYSPFNGLAYSIYLFLPIILYIYAFKYSKRRELKLVIIYSIFFSIIATGPWVPGLSLFVELIYNYIPLFNYIPALFRWDYFTVLSYTYVLGWLVTDMQLSAKGSGTPLYLRAKKILISLAFWKNKSYQLRAKTLMKLGVVMVILFVLFSQNIEVFTSPPTTFNFPSSLTDGYAYIKNQSSNSYTIEFPFGNIYCRSPWSGVSQSTEFLSPYLSTEPTVMFQAGTPYSLAIDKIIGYGETNGYTNNISKILAGLNVKYAIITNLGNSSYYSDPSINPITSDIGFEHQMGFGDPVYLNSDQRVYELPNVSSPLFFTNSYYIYFGGTDILYNIFDEPFYNFKDLLINGSSLNESNINQLTPYSSGIFITFNELLSDPFAVKIAAKYGIPVYAFISPAIFNVSTALKRVSCSWIASNNESYIVNSSQAALSESLPDNMLSTSNYNMLNFSVRADLKGSSSLTLEDNYNTDSRINDINNSGFSFTSLSTKYKSGIINLTVLTHGLVSINYVTLELYNNSIQIKQEFVKLPYTSENGNVYLNKSVVGPGFIVYTQTFNSYWNLFSNNIKLEVHIPGNIVANSWFIRNGTFTNVDIIYSTTKVLNYSISIEVVSIPGFVFFGVFIAVIDRRRTTKFEP